MNKVYKDVQMLAKKYEQLWWQMPDTLPKLPEFTDEEKNIRQNNLQNLLIAFNNQPSNIPSDSSKVKAFRDKLALQISEHAKGALGIEDKAFEDELITGSAKSTQDFTAKSREFDKDIPFQDIYQALRNLWILNVIQSATGNDISCTPSTFGYSLLYPYTDNFLDDCRIANDEKSQMTNRLKKRLNGDNISGSNAHEKKVFALVSIIESQYPRDKYPQVYDSIIAIHTAQCKSFAVQNKKSSPYENNILNISFEKGGSSVLADAYLACGDIDEKTAEFSFAFGTVLQLIDDLQDVKDDFDKNNMTIFSQTIAGYKLDIITNKFINFVICSMNFDYLNNPERKDDIKRLIINNLMVLLILSVYNNKDLYTKEYVKNIEKHFPISFKYYRNNKKNLNKLKSKLSSIKL